MMLLSAVRSAPEVPFWQGNGLGTEDNPIFHGMHEASALACGGSLLAAREIAEGRADRAINIAGGLHHAMADQASGFCVYNDCAVAISWLLDHGFDRVAYLDVDVHGDPDDRVRPVRGEQDTKSVVEREAMPLRSTRAHRGAGGCRSGTGDRGEGGRAHPPTLTATTRCGRAPTIRRD